MLEGALRYVRDEVWCFRDGYRLGVATLCARVRSGKKRTSGDESEAEASSRVVMEGRSNRKRLPHARPLNRPRKTET
jgi:hypothetical protein